MARLMVEQHPADGFLLGTSLTNFYREEFLKHREFLRLQREYFSEGAVADVEAALNGILGRLDVLCTHDDAGEVVSRLLRCFDLVTGAYAVCDPKKVH
jgi:hypothetical protein